MADTERGGRGDGGRVERRAGGGRGGRAAYHHGDLRRALLEAALSLVAERGASELSLREVARRAGVSHAAPYHHFADKSALLAAVAGEGFERLVAVLEDAVRGRRSLETELRAMAVAYVEFALANPTHYRVMFLPELKASAGSAELAAVSDRAFGLLEERAARARPGRPAREHRERATTVWAALHGLAHLALDDVLQGKVEAVDPFIRRATRSIVEMLHG